jgi:DNA-binding MarR family transcriptional regulator
VKFYVYLKRVLDDEELSPHEKLILITLASYSDHQITKQVYPSINTIAKKSGLSRSTTIRTLNTLAEKRLISRAHRTGEDGNATSNLYRLNTEYFSDHPYLQLVSTKD